MKRVFLGFLLLLPIQVLAADLKSVKDTLELSERIVGDFIDEKFERGLGRAKPYWPLPEGEFDNIPKLILEKWPIVERRFGRSIGMEFISTQKIGGSFLRHYYLHKLNNHAIYWELTFYKPQDKWIVNGIKFRDNFDVLFK